MMKNISLTELEVNELIDMYQTEIDRSQRRISNLQSIINKLKEDVTIDHSERTVKESIKSAAPKRIKSTIEPKFAKKKESRTAEQTLAMPVAAKKATMKRTSKKIAKAKVSKYKAIKGGTGDAKVKWSDTIINILKEKNSPILSSEIANEAIIRLQIPKENITRAKSAIATNITKLIKKNIVVKQPVEGKKGSLFGLV